MRVIKSKRQVKTGVNYHYCPVSGTKIEPIQCKGCQFLAQYEVLNSTYRIHCKSDNSAVKGIKPSHAEDNLPQAWGDDRFALRTHNVVEPKLDGVRLITVFDADGRPHFFTRNKNRFGDYSDVTANLPHLNRIAVPHLAGTILDGEVVLLPTGESGATGNVAVGTNTQTLAVIGSDANNAIATQEKLGYVHYYVFDCPQHRDVELYNEPLHVRWSRRNAALDCLPCQYIHQLPSKLFGPVETEAKRAYYNQLLAAGVDIDGQTLPVEGVVIKNIDAPYYELRAMIKVKETVSTDVIVTGWEAGKVGGKFAHTLGTLLFSVVDAATGKLREIGKVIPGDNNLRDRLYLRLKNLTADQIVAEGIVFEIEGQNWTKEYRIRHPRILRYRPDRSEPNVVDFTTVVRK